MTRQAPPVTRPRRNLALARTLTAKRAPGLWSPDGRAGWSAQRCPDCGDWTSRHVSQPRATRCAPCRAYRAQRIDADEWNSVVVDGTAELREEMGTTWVERASR